MRRRGLLGLLAIGVLGGAGCRVAERHGRSVVFASGAEIQTLNPLLTSHPLAKQIERYVLLTTLVRYDSSLVARPYLARSWGWSADRRTLTFHLARGVRWEDGPETTARDVVWTVNAARDPASGYPRIDDLSNIDWVRNPDDSTVVVRFARGQDGIPDVFTDLAILPAHLLDTVPVARMRSAAWNARPIGNGPFRLTRHEANRRWVFVVNPAFPLALGGPPQIERFVVVVVDEPTTKLAALSSGEVDFAGIQPAHAAFVRRDHHLALIEYPSLQANVIVFNTRRPPFDALRARAAVSLAIDRSAIVDGYLYGFGIPADRALDASGRGPATVAGADTAGARRLLGGRRAAFELLTVGSGEAPLEQMLQAQLARAGIDLAIRQLELSTYLDKLYGPRDFQAAVLGIGADLGMGYLAVLARLAGMPVGPDPAGARAIIRDSLPVAFLYYGRGLQGANRRVRGVRMDARGELPTIAQWSVAP